MIRILTTTDQKNEPELFDRMFHARAAVFHDRLKWQVQVTHGREFDRHDADEAVIYVVSVDHDGRPRGSLRVLPTTGSTMLDDEFSHLFTEPVHIKSPAVWECTRFCVHPLLDRGERFEQRRVSSELLIGLCTLALRSGIEQIIGLYDASMRKVYARIGWQPLEIAASRPEYGNLVLGRWLVTDAAIAAMHGKHSPGAVHKELKIAA